MEPIQGPLPDMALVSLPAGTFQMGSENGGGDEKPVHMVTVSAFAFMTKKVTQAQWRAVMGGNPSHRQGDNHPVEKVSWDDAQDFIRKLNQRDLGRGYRLPTEAEWEYACRAGSTGNWCFGNDEARLGDYAWYDANSREQSHPVGLKTANAWGMYDMHGNVWEWCHDWYGEYPTSSVTDPQGADSGWSRVNRGGALNSPTGDCRSASRSYFPPSGRAFLLGFRVAGNSL